MAYQTLLAHIPNEDISAEVLSAGALLAERHSAHLVGLHIKPPLDLYISSEMPIPLEVTRHFAEQQRVVESRIKTMFEQKTDRQSYVSEWRAIDAGTESVARVLTEHGNTADMLIMSQSKNADKSSSNRDLPEHVLMACGRPVLVIPTGEPLTSLGERVVVAWDGRRESTRALFGALPMLRRAGEVRLHRINLPHQDRHHVVGITEELANTLARHGVAVEVFHSDARSGEIANELVGYARDVDADVMVMGCYGHSPLREFLLGGTTRHVLRNIPLPVLMSN